MSTNLRDHVHRIAEALPPDATWDDVQYQVDLRASVEHGVADIKARRVIPVEDLMKEFGLSE